MPWTAACAPSQSIHRILLLVYVKTPNNSVMDDCRQRACFKVNLANRGQRRSVSFRVFHTQKLSMLILPVQYWCTEAVMIGKATWAIAVFNTVQSASILHADCSWHEQSKHARPPECFQSSNDITCQCCPQAGMNFCNGNNLGPTLSKGAQLSFMGLLLYRG